MSEEKAKKTEDVVKATPVVEAVKKAAPIKAAKEKVKKAAPVKAVKEKAEEAAPVKAVEEKVEEAAPVKAVEATPAETKEFDWDAYAEGGLALYSKSEYKDYEAMYEATLPEETQAGVIDGTVLNLTDREAIIEIGGKSEGVISLNEFRYNPELKVGDTVEVLIDQQEDKTGQLLLSHRKARSIRSWDRVNSAHDNEEIVNGFVK